MLRTLINQLPKSNVSRAALLTSSRSNTQFPNTKQLMIQNLVRQFKSSVPSNQAAAPSQSPKTDLTVSSLIDKYGGIYPLVGLGGFLALSKELLVLNEEFLMVSNFATMVFILWLTVGDTVTNMVKEDAAADKKFNDDLSDFQIETIEAAIKAHQLNISQVDVLKDLKNEYNTLVAQVVKAKDLKARAAARDAVLAKLQAIKQREDSEKAAYSSEVFEKTSSYVKSAFVNLPKQQKDILIDYAINVISGQTAALDSKTDPVKKLYRDYLNSKQYEKEIDADRKAKEGKMKQ